MSIPLAFQFNQNAKYRTGGVYEPTHQFSLVGQTIQINKTGSFKIRFPDIWNKYKLPQIKDPTIYDDWLSNQMQFWQNQVNFAVWCATTGCGVSKQHLTYHDPIIRSVFRFHVYYQIRRILNELQCPLPNAESFNELKNGINQSVYEQICNEFNVDLQANWRQNLDPLNGFGSVRYYSSHIEYSHHKMRGHKVKVLEKGDTFQKGFVVKIPSSGKFHSESAHTYKVEYIEQYFDHDPGYTDVSSDKSIYSAIGSFVADKAMGFTQPGIPRINDSIRTFVWAILGAQSQVRSSILGEGKAFDAQKQFLANVEDAINSAVDIPYSIDRYQSALQYARSKLDFVIGQGLYLIPSDNDLYIGTINGFNNLIRIASPDKINQMQLGYNNHVNDEVVVPQETFESPPDDFDFEDVDETPIETTVDETPIETPIETPVKIPVDDFDETPAEKIPTEKTPTQKTSTQKTSTQKTSTQKTSTQKTLTEKTLTEKKLQKDLSHDETKLLLTLGGITFGAFLIWFYK